MGFVDHLKRLLGARPPEPQGTELIYVRLPEPLEPDERELRYGEPLDAELRLRRLGYVSGGGALLSAPKADGSCEIIYCGVDVDAVDVVSTRQFLRDFLPMLGCRPGTCLEYREASADLQDEFDGERWVIGTPTPVHPDYDGDGES